MSIAVADIEKLAFSLTEKDRARLASRLLSSLPPVPAFDDDDDGIAEALRRDKEMDEDPSKVMTLEELDGLIAERLRR
jgi:hypothetical protein